jgi:hypothetical protein
MFKKIALIGASLVAGSSFAAVDITTATAGIADAQTAVLAVLGLMVTMAAAVLAVRLVLQHVKRGG